jgi:hypothetical protein
MVASWQQVGRFSTFGYSVFGYLPNIYRGSFARVNPSNIDFRCLLNVERFWDHPRSTSTNGGIRALFRGISLGTRDGPLPVQDIVLSLVNQQSESQDQQGKTAQYRARDCAELSPPKLLGWVYLTLGIGTLAVGSYFICKGIDLLSQFPQGNGHVFLYGGYFLGLLGLSLVALIWWLTCQCLVPGTLRMASVLPFRALSREVARLTVYHFCGVACAAVEKRLFSKSQAR